MLYPKHIYDESRQWLAQEIMVKELSKLFPGMSSHDLSRYIEGWKTNPAEYHLEDGTRDFWDIFAAILESIKIKPGFTAYLTAANVRISQESLDPRSITLSSFLAQLHRLDLQWSDTYTVGAALDAMSDTELQRQREINDSHSTEAQDAYPIIVRRDPDGTLKVLDGNRRSLRAGLYGKPKIAAWVIDMPSETLRDFWVPVNDMMQVTKLYRAAPTAKHKQAAVHNLETIFTHSKVARITYEARIIKQSNPWADELYEVVKNKSN